MIELIISAITLAITAVSAAYTTAVSETGSAVKTDLGKLAKDIKNKIGNNNALLAKITQAYQTKNAAYLNRLFTGMGFGPRMQSIVKTMEKEDKNYSSEMSRINDENTKLEAQLNNIDSGYQNAGTSLSGNVAANKIYEKEKNNLEQNVQGGAINA